MNDFEQVIKKLKKHIANGKEVKVLDKDVASLLGVSQTQLATLKRRNSTPYKDLLEFCKREDICCNKIFFD